MAWWARKEPGRYQIAWREPDGKKRYKTFARFEDGRRFKSDLESRLDRGDYAPVETRKMKLGAYMDLVLGSGDLAASTFANYEYRRRHTRPLEQKAIGDVTTADIRGLLARMEGQGIGPEGRKSVRKLLAKVFTAAVKEGVLVRNPAYPIPNPRVERKEPHIFTPREIQALSEAVPSELRGAVLLSAYGGLRAGEVCAVRGEDVDWLRGTVTISRAVSLVRGVPVMSSPKTKGSVRTVAVPGFVLEALPRVVQGQLLFGGSPKHLSEAFTVAVKKCGLEGRWHDLRHTSVALAIEQGAHPKQIQTRLGHSNISTTLDIYGHLFPGMDERLAEKMGEAYGGTEPGEVVPLVQQGGA